MFGEKTERVSTVEFGGIPTVEVWKLKGLWEMSSTIKRIRRKIGWLLVYDRASIRTWIINFDRLEDASRRKRNWDGYSERGWIKFEKGFLRYVRLKSLVVGQAEIGGNIVHGALKFREERMAIKEDQQHTDEKLARFTHVFEKDRNAPLYLIRGTWKFSRGIFWTRFSDAGTSSSR